MADENPLDISDDEINKIYRHLWDNAQGNFKHDVTASLLTSEINRRLVDKTTQESTKHSNLSLKISFLALMFASLSAIFSFIDWQADSKWQEQQIEALNKINNSIELEYKTSTNTESNLNKININVTKQTKEAHNKSVKQTD